MHLPQVNKGLSEHGDTILKTYEMKLAKYMDRMFDMVQCRLQKYGEVSEAAIFAELDKVVLCQLNMEIAQDNNDRN